MSSTNCNTPTPEVSTPSLETVQQLCPIGTKVNAPLLGQIATGHVIGYSERTDEVMVEVEIITHDRNGKPHDKGALMLFSIEDIRYDKHDEIQPIEVFHALTDEIAEFQVLEARLDNVRQAIHHARQSTGYTCISIELREKITQACDLMVDISEDLSGVLKTQQEKADDLYIKIRDKEMD